MLSWGRTKLPDQHQPWLLQFTVWLAVAGAIGISTLAVMSASLHADATAFNLVLMASACVLGLAATTLMAGLIIREIRHLAFDAALRAGEVRKSPTTSAGKADGAPGQVPAHQTSWSEYLGR